jgi:hypothetical protein
MGKRKNRRGTAFAITLPKEPKIKGGENAWVNPLEYSSLMMMRT